jgi:hypothetical protein
MTILSKKNKAMLFKVLGWFGAAVLALIVWRSVKTPDGEDADTSSVNDKLAAFTGQVKDLFRLSVIALPLFFAIGFAVQEKFELSALALFVPGIGLPMLGVALGTLTTGVSVVSTFNTTYVPKYFWFAAATQLTGVKITVQGDGVIFDMDANGLNHLGVNRVIGQVTNGYFFTISNGFIPGKNVIWEFTNSAAQTPTVYVSSDESPATGLPMYLQGLRQAVLAGSGQNFEKLATISFPSIAATDVVNVLYNDGTQQQLNRADIQAQLGNTQSIVNTPVYMLDNFAGRLKTVNIIAGANQTAYVQRWVGAIGNQMISQTVNN